MSTVAAATAAQQASATGTTALSSLSGNFQTFLKLLMSQLQNQDPTSPLDTNQFTSQLVEFASVEQQINANTSLSKLIELTQSDQVMQSASMVGRQVEVESDRLSLQNGTAGIRFTAATAGPVAIAVYAENGQKIADGAVNAVRGSNDWTWNGRSGSGVPMPDGTYRVAVTGAKSDGTNGALPFTVLGTATGVKQDGTSINLLLGGLSVGFGAVRSVKGAAAG